MWANIEPFWLFSHTIGQCVEKLSNSELKREQLTAAWLGQRKQKKKKKRIHSTQQHSVPNVSRPVAQKNGMEAYHQAAALLGPLISWPVWKKFCQHCTAGWPGIWRWFHWLDACTKFLHHHSKCIVHRTKCASVKTLKQLAAEILQQPWWWLHPVPAGRTFWHGHNLCPLVKC